MGVRVGVGGMGVRVAVGERVGVGVAGCNGLKQLDRSSTSRIDMVVNFGMD